MKLRTLDDLNFKGKSVLLRADLNSEVVNGKVFLGDRLIESSRTIKELTRKGAKVVVIAHQGRKGDKDFISLKQHAKLLNRYVKVKFIDDVFGKKALGAIDKLKFGEALLLENVRFCKEEFLVEGKNKMVEALKDKFDYFVNDAFSVSHRAQASVVCFNKNLVSAVGRLMERELKSLDRLKIEGGLFILGGAKIEEDLFLAGRGKVFTGGIVALTFMRARGMDLGKQNEIVDKNKKLFAKIRTMRKVKTPLDFAILQNGKRKEIMAEEFPINSLALDIGKETIKEYLSEIKRAKVIFVKGPMGYIEDKRFIEGTREILKAVANSKAFSVIAGGHTGSTLKQLGIDKKKFSYISLSGGALVEYLAGKKLPGIEALRNGK